jgi:hypothetical protein
MSEHAGLAETDDFAVFNIFIKRREGEDDFYVFGRGSSYDHILYLTYGELLVQEENERPFTVVGPAAIRIKADTEVRFDYRSPTAVLYCIHNKTSANWDHGIERIVGAHRAVNRVALAVSEATPDGS